MEETKRCPYCGQQIKAVAKKCRYCGKWLDVNPVLTDSKISSPVTSTPKSKNGKDNVNPNHIRNIILILMGVVIIIAVFYFINSSKHNDAEEDTAIEEIIIEPEESDYIIE